jgi:hypothetical protein
VKVLVTDIGCLQLEIHRLSKEGSQISPSFHQLIHIMELSKITKRRKAAERRHTWLERKLYQARSRPVKSHHNCKADSSYRRRVVNSSFQVADWYYFWTRRYSRLSRGCLTGVSTSYRVARGEHEDRRGSKMICDNNKEDDRTHLPGGSKKCKGEVDWPLMELDG